MRRFAWVLLLLCIFTIPWEYSLDFGAPLGNIARLLGIAALLGTIFSVLQAGRFRSLGAVHWLIVAYFLWFCCTLLWSIDREASFEKVRGYFQECMIAWLIWELADSLDQVRSILRAWVAGSCVLALLTVAKLAVWGAGAAQLRFAAYGQDPNDTARFLDLGFPAAAMLLTMSRTRFERSLGSAYFPIAALAVLATASRGGTTAALLAWIGCGALSLQHRKRNFARLAWAIPLFALAVWLLVPSATLARITTVAEQIQGGDLNQRTTIWQWGWEAARARLIFGSGAGTFATAAGLAPIDTAHNTALSILVEGGIVGLALASATFVECLRLVSKTNRRFRIGSGTLLGVWAVCSTVGTAAESRTTWLMVGVISVMAGLGQYAEGYHPESALRNHIIADPGWRPASNAQEFQRGDEN